MASLREEARWILDDAKAGISWIAVWKTGRSWHAESFYEIEYTDRTTRLQKQGWKIDGETAETLRKIYAEDENAILVNAYYCNLGPFEEMTLETLIDGIKFQYGFGGDIMDILNKAEIEKSEEAKEMEETREIITEEQEQVQREPEKTDYIQRINALPAEDQAFMDGYLFARLTAERPA